MSPVKQVRYSGQSGRVLVDVGALNDGDVVDVHDDLADSLISSFPDNYSLVEAEVEVEVEVEPDSASTKTSKKSAPADTPTSTDTTTTDNAAS